MKKAVVLACAAAVACCAEAVTWRVNLQSGDDVAAAADETGATPFITIQAAVAKAAAGETVLVDPGTYTGPATTNSSYGVSRIHITKAITIEATGTRDNTIIEGRWDTETDPVHGLGPNAIRCVCATAGVTIKGFTFLNGATPSGSDASPNCGGGFYGGSNSIGSRIVDCAFLNCSSTRGGGMRYGYAIRTLFKGCYASTYGGAMREVGASFCVFDGCSGSRTCAYVAHVYQCTFINNFNDNEAIHANSAKTVRNCVFVSGKATGNANVTFDGCWFYSSSSGNATANGNTHFGVVDGLVSPLFGDLRPVAGGVLDGVAPNCSEYLLEGYRDLDFEGKPVDWSEGKLCPGAFQDVVTPSSGRVVFHNATARLFVDGVAVGDGDASSNYVYEVCWPTQHHIRAVASAAGKDILRVDMTLNGVTRNDKRPPLNVDNEAWITAPPPGNVCEYSPFETADILWVDANAEYEGEADGTEAKPYRILQEAAAVNVVASGGGNRIIKVKKGVYDKGLGASKLYGSSNRVEVCNGGFPRFVAVDGPEETLIVGSADSEAEEVDNGCGAAAVRCVAANQNCVFVGFTLTGGHSGISSNSASTSDTVQGGAVKCTGNSDNGPGGAVFVDCIITNNVAWRGVGYGGQYLRCYIADSDIIRIDCSLIKAVAANCLFERNVNSAGVMKNQYAYNCTFVEQGAAKALAYSNVNLYNCVCYAKKAGENSPIDTSGSISWGFTFSDDRVLKADPLFRDMVGGDYHMASVSPAVGLGDPTVGEWWIYAGADFEGNRYRLVDGRVISGAFQTLVSSVRVGVSAGPDTGVSTNGVVFLDGPESVTVTATDAATRIYKGFAINGEIVEGSGASAAFTYSNPETMPVPGETLNAVYLTNWYVNATTGDDTLKSGESPELAKKTLAAALTYAASGDVVHVAEGTYDTGSMLHPTFQSKMPASQDVPYIPARAWVKKGVQLVADGARENTVILGKSDPGTVDDSEKQGCGPNAVRCVLMDVNTVVRGFTIRGGRVDWENIEDDNNQGGGVLASKNGEYGECLVEDCSIENCRARRGGGTRWGTFVRCRFLGNSATSNGSAARHAYVIGCFFDNNIGPDVVAYTYKVVCCTFGPNNKQESGIISPPFGSISGSGQHIIGSLFCTAGRQRGLAYVNCAIPNGVTLESGVEFTNCVRAAAADLAQIDENGVPIAGLNPACDGGDISQWIEYGMDAAKDAAGNPRIANAAMDIGCYEADWKGRYAADICKRSGLTVNAADAYAHEEENGEVYLPGGEVSGTLGETGRFAFPVRITGSGSLTVTVDGTSTCYAGPLAAFQLETDAAVGSSLTFAYAPGDNDAGGAFIGLGGRVIGTMFSIR